MDEYTKTRLLRGCEVESLTALKRSAIYDKVAHGAFPPPVKIGPRSVRWRYGDILEWIEKLPSAVTEEKESGAESPYNQGPSNHSAVPVKRSRHQPADSRTRRVGI